MVLSMEEINANALGLPQIFPYGLVRLVHL